MANPPPRDYHWVLTLQWDTPAESRGVLVTPADRQARTCSGTFPVPAGTSRDEVFTGCYERMVSEHLPPEARRVCVLFFSLEPDEL